MKNRILHTLFLILLFSCKQSKELKIYNRLESCINNEDIDLLKKDKENKKGKKLFITEVKFNTKECIGLFRYEYAHARMSVGLSTYVLKGKDRLFIQSKNKNDNEQTFEEYIGIYRKFFTESDINYMRVKFIDVGVPRGKMSSVPD